MQNSPFIFNVNKVHWRKFGLETYEIAKEKVQVKCSWSLQVNPIGVMNLLSHLSVFDMVVFVSG